MQLPLQITARDISLTPAIERAIRGKVQKLERLYENILGCTVVVTTPHRHQHKGGVFNILVRLTVPGGELVVRREPHQDLYVAIRDTFDAARRQLLSFASRQRGDIKQHSLTPLPALPELA